MSFPFLFSSLITHVRFFPLEVLEFLIPSASLHVWSSCPPIPGLPLTGTPKHAECILTADSIAVHLRYEFAHNEYVNVAESVSLETLSAEKGEKDFIVVGTTIYRGEDLAVKGAVSAIIIAQHVALIHTPLDVRFRCRGSRPAARLSEAQE